MDALGGKSQVAHDCGNRQEDVAVTKRSRSLFAAAVGLWMALPVLGEEPAGSPLSSNQEVANAIVERLQQSAQLRQSSIDVVFQDGTVDLTGVLNEPGQHAQVVRIVGSVPGVKRIHDRLQVNSALTQVQAIEPPPGLPFPGTVTEAGSAPPPGVLPGAGPAVGEPMPVWQAPPPNPYDLNPPKMPPYAWPTYAPYNNYSRVAYPTNYPYNAWPYVGPIYPFPKIPPGWRKVSLEWQDGYWWYAPHANSHDWWVLRYW
jgi:hypothetical protein